MIDIINIDGTIQLGASESRHVQDTLIQNQGDNKFTPLIGIGIRRKLGGTKDYFLENEIKMQLNAQGILINEVTNDLDTLLIQ